jgi:TolB-like protein/DNA-binding winged helix-turn-helix (wHTH) protein/cytochrome c-type biogenesis protein CcmH/NrfG
VASLPLRSVRFGPFEADLHSGELRKSGVKLRLTGQPYEILAMLLEKPGELVTREELRQRLWPENTFVDYEHSLNAAVNKLREVLSDSADRPLYVETLPRRGYRFIAPVQGPAAAVAAAPPALPEPGSATATVVPEPAERPDSAPPRRRVGRAAVLGSVLLVIAILAGILVWRSARRSAAAPSVRALAVLPFANLSRDPEQEYFADGITEALISRLSQIRALHVVSRTSVMQYRGTRQALPEIARRLSVDAIVEGTVQRAGDRVAIFANLVEASSDRSLWTGRYEGGLRDVLGLQSQVAGAIAEGIRARVTPEERRRVHWSRAVDPEAYAAYLKGRYFQEKGLPWATNRAVDQFRQSLSRDPRFAPAWVRLGEAELFGFPPAERMPEAKKAVLRGLELYPSLPEGHVVLGLVQTFWDRDWAEAEKSFRRALELDPASSDAHYRYSHLLVALGRFDEAIAECRKALDLDPLSPNVGHYLGRIYYFARRYDAAVEQFQKVLALDPNDYWSNLFLSVVSARQGRPDEAAHFFERAATIGGMKTEGISAMREEYRRGGRRAALRKALELLHPETSGPIGSSASALTWAEIGDREQTLVWLEKAFESHTRDLVYVNVEPAYDFLRGDPRFDAIVKRIGFIPAAAPGKGRS